MRSGETVPNTARNRPSTPIATTLFATGAQVYAPKRFRAFSTSPSTAYMPRKKICGMAQ